MLIRSKLIFVGTLLMFSATAFADAASCWNPQGNSSLTVGDVDGGNSGAFVREMSKTGYDGIQACLDIPNFEDSIGGEPQCLYNTQCPRSPAEKALERAHPHNLKRTPYLYLGFKSVTNYTVETGLEYEPGCCYVDHNKKDKSDLGKIVYYKKPAFRLYRRNVKDLPQGQLTQTNTNIRYIDDQRFYPGDQVCMNSTLDPVSKNFTFHVDGRRPEKGKLVSIEKSDTVFPSKIASVGPLGIKDLQVRRVTEISSSLNGVTIGGFTTGVAELKNSSLNVDWKNTKAKNSSTQAWLPFNENLIQSGGESKCLGTVTWPAKYTKATESNGVSDPRSVGDHFENVSYESQPQSNPAVLADTPEHTSSAGSAN
jgi:hypothetical protein